MAGLESPWHIAILAIVLVVVFGSKRLPEIGRSMGTGMREFKRSVSGQSDERPTLDPGTHETRTPVINSSAARLDRDAIT